jgi:hypothetical protein
MAEPVSAPSRGRGFSLQPPPDRRQGSPPAPPLWKCLRRCTAQEGARVAVHQAGAVHTNQQPKIKDSHSESYMNWLSPATVPLLMGWHMLKNS